jgi:hypothetical protein
MYRLQGQSVGALHASKRGETFSQLPEICVLLYLLTYTLRSPRRMSLAHYDESALW